MKLTKRLSILANLVPKGDNVYDIGCDHALLDIYLTQYNENKCYACDINENALEFAKKNIQKYNLEDKIEIIVSDGFKSVPIESGTAVISGMGTNTILNILNNPKIEKLDSIIIQTNNDYALLRKKISEIGYKIVYESTLLEKNIYYIFMKIKRGKAVYNKYDLEYGPLLRKSNEIETCILYKHLYETKKEILKKMPRKYLGKKMNLKKEISWLKRKLRKWNY